jgi:predicted metallopeptidase
MEEVATKIMKVNKATKLFQTMAIMNLNMGYLTLEINILKNRLITREKAKIMLHEELDKERNFEKGYKHNVEIWKKNRAEAEQKIKMFIKKL